MTTMRLCFLGDSFVNGYGDPGYLGWTGRLCASARAAGHDVTAYNLSVRRDTSLDIARRWRAEVEVRAPQGVPLGLVFSFGVKDTVIEDGQVRVQTTQSVVAARSMLGEALAIAPVLFIGPPPVDDDEQNERIAVLNAALESASTELGIPFLNVLSELRASNIWASEARANDGAHPGAQGYQELADLVSHWGAWREWFGRR